MVYNLEVDGHLSEDNLSPKQRLDLLKNEVYESIKRDFGISITTAKRLSFLKTETGLNTLDDIKNNLKSSEEISQTDKDKILGLSNNRLEDLYNALTGAEKILQTPRIENIEIIKAESNTFIRKLIGERFYNNVLYPKNNLEQVMGVFIGGAESIESTIKLLIDIGKGLILGPYHIYLLISGNGEYKFNK